MRVTNTTLFTQLTQFTAGTHGTHATHHDTKVFTHFTQDLLRTYACGKSIYAGTRNTNTDILTHITCTRKAQHGLRRSYTEFTQGYEGCVNKIIITQFTQIYAWSSLLMWFFGRMVGLHVIDTKGIPWIHKGT
jgi:hypothetical protein